MANGHVCMHAQNQANIDAELFLEKSWKKRKFWAFCDVMQEYF